MGILAVCCGKGIRQYGLVSQLSSGVLSLLMVLSLTGCKTFGEDESADQQTSLKAVSDSEHILRLAPYQGKGTEYVFEVCHKASTDQGCPIAFLSSARQPVVFTAEEVYQHRQSAIEAFTKLVAENPELAVAAGSAAAAPAAYQVSTMLTSPSTALAERAEVISMLDDQGFKTVKEASDFIGTKDKVMMEQLGVQISDFTFAHQTIAVEGEVVTIRIQDMPEKLKAHWATQPGILHPHVYKQDFVDFLISKYSDQLLAYNKNTKKAVASVLHYHDLHSINSTSKYPPKIDFEKLIEEYRMKLHGSLSDAAKTDYASITRDIMDPSMADEFRKYNNLRQIFLDTRSGTGTSAFHQFLEASSPKFIVDEKIVSGLSSLEDVLNHMDQFSRYHLPYLSVSKKQAKLIEDMAKLKHGIKTHFPNEAAFQKAKNQLRKLDLTPNQAVKKALENKRLAKRVSVVFVVVAGIMAGASGVKNVWGVGDDKGHFESVAHTYPSLFDTDGGTSYVDTVQGIVVQLGEYLNKSGVDIDYYCMPYGCRTIY